MFALVTGLYPGRRARPMCLYGHLMPRERLPSCIADVNYVQTLFREDEKNYTISCQT